MPAERNDGQPRVEGHLADPRHLRYSPGVWVGLQAAVRDDWRRHRLDGGNHVAHAVDDADSRRIAVPDDGTLRDAGGLANLLDDTRFNIDEWLAEEVRLAFADQEGTAFVSGDGANKPKGLLGYPTSPTGHGRWVIGFIATGVAGFPGDEP